MEELKIDPFKVALQKQQMRAEIGLQLSNTRKSLNLSINHVSSVLKCSHSALLRAEQGVTFKDVDTVQLEYVVWLERIEKRRTEGYGNHLVLVVC